MKTNRQQPAPKRPSALAAAFDADSEESVGNRLIMLFWAGVWLFWMLQPFIDAIRHIDTVGGMVGVVVVPVFCVVYLWHFYACRAAFFRLSYPWGYQVRSRDVLRYLGLGALAIVCIVAVGQDGIAAAIFFALSGLWTLPLIWGWITVFSTAVAYVLLWNLPGWHADPSTFVGLGFGGVAITVGMVAGRRQHQLRESRQVNAELMVQQERNRMARDLHDILGHSLTVITVKAELAGRLMDAGAEERARTEVADLERLSRTALADVRRAVEGYREISLSGELARAKEALAAAGITASTPTALDQVPADLVEPFAWTVRESVTNVLRHSRASTCSITVTPTSITVRDDGVGCAASAGDGNGLAGLRERALSAGAVLITRSVEPHGFSVTVVASSDTPGPLEGPDAQDVAQRHTVGRPSGEATA
ncbi:histidine kinase [Flexivirga endophytica]|uniref:Histidine kinase n=1 Tax=Flexivirga endophytica TaxID=1849103 RepID=A0A916TDK7_9MICO|nr:sensor histidine kinase [Flexivirga endophytica]GGB41230.1 histidine kinase [Flexivirga endophytica]GHB49073.1 histidine kinase [Flexivirga endophytica]